MKKALMIGLVAAALGGACVSAQAMPAAPLDQTALATTDVAFGCGPYRHPGPRGFCVPNRPVRFYAPYRPRFYGRPYRWRDRRWH
jgi:hypothetical protein